MAIEGEGRVRELLGGVPSKEVDQRDRWQDEGGHEREVHCDCDGKTGGRRRRCNQRGVVDSRDHAAGGGATHVVPALLESCVSLQQYSKTVSHGRP